MGSCVWSVVRLVSWRRWAFMLQVIWGYVFFGDRLTGYVALAGVRGWVRSVQVGAAESLQRRAGLRLEALSRSLPLGSQTCLVCVGRTHPGRVRRRQLPELRGLTVGVVAHGGEHDVGQFPLQAAQSFASGFAGGSFAFVVGPAFGVAADLGDRDGIERAVELSVPAGIEPVPHGPPGGGGQWGPTPTSGCWTPTFRRVWMHHHTAPSANCGDQNRPSWGFGGWMRRPFLRPVRTCTAWSSPRLTRCNRVWRDTP